MTLKTDWIGNPELRSKLGYFDICVIGIQLTYNLSLVFYALYLDTKVICRYFWYRLKKSLYFKQFEKLKNNLQNYFKNPNMPVNT